MRNVAGEQAISRRCERPHFDREAEEKATFYIAVYQWHSIGVALLGVRPSTRRVYTEFEYDLLVARRAYSQFRWKRGG